MSNEYLNDEFIQSLCNIDIKDLLLVLIRMSDNSVLLHLDDNNSHKIIMVAISILLSEYEPEEVSKIIDYILDRHFAN